MLTQHFHNTSSIPLLSSLASLVKRVAYRCLVYLMVADHLLLSLVQAMGPHVQVNVSPLFLSQDLKQGPESAVRINVWSQDENSEQIKTLYESEVRGSETTKILSFKGEDAANKCKLEIDGKGKITVLKLKTTDQFNLTTCGTINFLAKPMTIYGLTLKALNIMNEGQIQVTDKLHIFGGGHALNNGSLVSHGKLALVGSPFILENRGKIQGHILKIAVSELVNLGEMCAEKKASIITKKKFYNSQTASFTSKENACLVFDGNALNIGSMRSLGFCYFQAGTLVNGEHGTLEFLDNLLIAENAVLANKQGGAITTFNYLYGDLDPSFRQNQGAWHHSGVIATRNKSITLKGQTIWKDEPSCVKALNYNYGPLTIFNQGDCFLQSQGIQSPQSLRFVNAGTLTANDGTLQHFTSLENSGTINLEGKDWHLMRSSQGLCLSSREGIDENSPKTRAHFVNSGNLNVSGSLTTDAGGLLGRANIGQDLSFVGHHRISLKDLVSVKCAGTVLAHIGYENIWEDLDLTSCNTLELITDASLSLSVKLTAQILHLTVNGDLTLGGSFKFPSLAPGHIQTTKGSLSICAQNIKGPNAILDAATTINLVSPKGIIRLGAYKLAPAVKAHKLGPWKGRAVYDKFWKAKDDDYRAMGDTLLHANKIRLAASLLDISYCQFFSQAKTKLASPRPLDLVSVDFLGHGNLMIESPEVRFNFAGTGKALYYIPYSVPRDIPYTGSEREYFLKWYEYHFARQKPRQVYDFLRSKPCQINHLGDVAIKARKVSLVGTEVTANNFLVNCLPYRKGQKFSSLQLIPIPLGKVKLHQQYGDTREKLYGRKVKRTFTFREAAQILRGDHSPGIICDGGLNGLAYDLRHGSFGFEYSLYESIPVLKNASVAEIDSFGQHHYSQEVAEAIARAHDGEEPFRYWSGKAITPTLTIGDKTKLTSDRINAQMTASTRRLSIKAHDSHLYNKTPRRKDPATMPQEVKLKGTDIGRKIDQVQKRLGHAVAGRQASELSKLPLTSSSAPTASNIANKLSVQTCNNLPVDLLIQAALREYAGCLYHEGASGPELLDRVIKHSQEFKRDFQKQAPTSTLIPFDKIQACPTLLLYIDTNVVNAQNLRELMLHIPANLQNRHCQAGDISFEKGTIVTKGDNRFSNTRLIVNKDATVTGKNVTLESTPKLHRQQTSSTMTVPAPLEIYIASQAQMTIASEDHTLLKGVTVEANGKLATRSGKCTTTTTVDMVDITSIHHGTQQRGHHLRTTIAGPGSYSGQAQQHNQNGSKFGTSHNYFTGGGIKAKTKVDYDIISTWRKKRNTFGSKTVSEFVQIPVDASVTTYEGVNDIEVVTFSGKGVVFKGKTTERTKIMELEPAEAQHLYQLQKSKKWVGITKGVKINQGKEQLLKPVIEGSFKSYLHPDRAEAENVLHLTSTILDIYEEQIEKRLIRDERIPKEWSRIKQTGNFKEVAMTVSALISVVSMNWGGMLIADNVMAKAAVSSLCSHTASSLICNQGDMKQVAKDLMSFKNLKNVTVAAISAGVADKLLSKTGFVMQSLAYQQMPELAQRFTREMTKAAVSLHVDYAISGGSYSKKFQENMVRGVVSTVNGYLCGMAGAGYKNHQIDPLLHKLIHGALGGLSSYALGENVAAGTIGPMVAHSVAELFYDAEYQKLQAQQKELNGRVQRGEVSPQHAQTQIDIVDERCKSLKDSCTTLGKYAAIAAATIARADPNVALRAAITALEENFNKHNNLTSQEEEEEEEQEKRKEEQELARQGRMKEIRFALEIHRYDFKQECLNAWKETIFGENAPTPRTLRRYDEDLNRIYDRVAGKQVGVNSLYIRRSYEASQGKENYIQQRIKELAQGEKISSEEATLKYHATAEKMYETYQLQEISQNIGGAITTVGGVQGSIGQFEARAQGTQGRGTITSGARAATNQNMPGKSNVSGASKPVPNTKSLPSEAKKKVYFEKDNRGKAKNYIKPNPLADGDHSVFRTDDKGKVIKYETFQSNPLNPTGYDSVKRVDMTGEPHYNKKTGETVPAPHVQNKNIPGGVRPALPGEIPSAFTGTKNENK